MERGVLHVALFSAGLKDEAWFLATRAEVDRLERTLGRCQLPGKLLFQFSELTNASVETTVQGWLEKQARQAAA